MTTATAVLDTIRGYLGVTENPAHSNETIIGVKFGWNGVPWCAETVTVCQHEAGNTTFDGSASCSVLVARYQDHTNGEWLGNPGAAGVQPGDEFFLGSRGQDHTGLVEQVDGDTIVTVEGNWADKVARVRRPVSAFYGFGRPDYTPPAPPEDDDMTDDDRKLVQAAIDAANNAATIASDIRNLIKDPTAGILHRLDSVEQKIDTPVDELRRNLRRVGTAVHAVGIEGTV